MEVCPTWTQSVVIDLVHPHPLPTHFTATHHRLLRACIGCKQETVQFGMLTAFELQTCSFVQLCTSYAVTIPGCTVICLCFSHAGCGVVAVASAAEHAPHTMHLSFCRTALAPCVTT